VHYIGCTLVEELVLYPGNIRLWPQTISLRVSDPEDGSKQPMISLKTFHQEHQVADSTLRSKLSWNASQYLNRLISEHFGCQIEDFGNKQFADVGHFLDAESSESNPELADEIRSRIFVNFSELDREDLFQDNGFLLREADGEPSTSGVAA
jgi:hypothetical protein